MADPGQEHLDTNVPQTARIWNYWLGGKDNFAADRQVGDEIRQAFPQPAARRATPGTSTPTAVTRRRYSRRRPAHSTSTGRSR
jgi:hypothetical protein